MQFQSTLPAWGETRAAAPRRRRRIFQSTLPAWGETPSGANRPNNTRFQSTLPAWGETCWAFRWILRRRFQSTLPAWGETRRQMDTGTRTAISIHSPRMGRDLLRPWIPWRGHYFNPLSPHGERQQTHTTFRREKLAHLHNIVSFRQQRGSSF